MTHDAQQHIHESDPPAIHARSIKDSFWTPERDRELIDAIGLNKSWDAIAADMGKHKSAVAGRIKRLKDAGAIVIPADYRTKQVRISNAARAGRPLQRPAAAVDADFQPLGIHGIEALEQHMCRFECSPHDTYDPANPVWCGHHIVEGASFPFCSHHQALCVRPADPARRR